MEINATKDIEEKDILLSAISNFSEAVKDSFVFLASTEGIYNSFKYKDKQISLTIENTAAYERTLVFDNASGGLRDIEYDLLYFDYSSIEKNETGYTLSGKAINYSSDITIPFSIYFTDAYVNTKVFSASSNHYHTPWNYIQFMAIDILAKSEIKELPLNKQELNLLPLLTEITKLTYWTYDLFLQKNDNFNFPILKNFAKKYNYKKIVKKLEKIESIAFSKKSFTKYTIHSNSLLMELNKLQYMPLWNEISELIINSQEEYKNIVTHYCPVSVLNDIRSQITKELHSAGFEGEYPLFKMNDSLKGFHLFDSYDVSYTILNEKNMCFYIYVTEHFINNELVIKFACMAERIKKNQQTLGPMACLFNDKGNRYCFSFLFTNERTLAGYTASEKLSKYITIAIKKAKLIKLTKEEQREYFGFDISYTWFFIINFVFMGGLFSVPFTLLFMIFVIAAELLSGNYAKISSIIFDPIWLLMIIMAWILFGGTMSLVLLFSKKR